MWPGSGLAIRCYHKTIRTETFTGLEYLDNLCSSSVVLHYKREARVPSEFSFYVGTSLNKLYKISEGRSQTQELCAPSTRFWVSRRFIYRIRLGPWTPFYRDFFAQLHRYNLRRDNCSRSNNVLLLRHFDLAQAKV